MVAGGSAASSGIEGSGPTVVSRVDSVLPVPMANPPPLIQDSTQNTALGMNPSCSRVSAKEPTAPGRSSWYTLATSTQCVPTATESTTPLMPTAATYPTNPATITCQT